MVFCAEEQIMKLYDGKGRLRTALRHAYIIKEPTGKLWSYNRPGGILGFLQNNNGMLCFIL